MELGQQQIMGSRAVLLLDVKGFVDPAGIVQVASTQPPFKSSHFILLSAKALIYCVLSLLGLEDTEDGAQVLLFTTGVRVCTICRR